MKFLGDRSTSQQSYRIVSGPCTAAAAVYDSPYRPSLQEHSWRISDLSTSHSLSLEYLRHKTSR